MNEPDWRDRQTHDSAAASMTPGGSARFSRRVEFAMTAEPRADTSYEQGEGLTEVWEYLSKH